MNNEQHRASNEVSTLTTDRFPRAAAYDQRWVPDCPMGRNPLWLAEWLTAAADLRRETRVLGLGGGTGVSSIFLAREFGVQVWAADFWASPTRISDIACAAGLADQVFPIHADARNLPFAEQFFDAIVCVDPCICFSTDDLDLDLDRLARFVRPAGQLGIVIPGFMQEIDGALPDHLRPLWAQECWSWHTIDSWRWLWQRTGLVSTDIADSLPDDWRLWAVRHPRP